MVETIAGIVVRARIHVAELGIEPNLFAYEAKVRPLHYSAFSVIEVYEASLTAGPPLGCTTLAEKEGIGPPFRGSEPRALPLDDFSNPGALSIELRKGNLSAGIEPASPGVGLLYQTELPAPHADATQGRIRTDDLPVCSMKELNLLVLVFQTSALPLS